MLNLLFDALESEVNAVNIQMLLHGKTIRILTTNLDDIPLLPMSYVCAPFINIISFSKGC